MKKIVQDIIKPRKLRRDFFASLFLSLISLSDNISLTKSSLIMIELISLSFLQVIWRYEISKKSFVDDIYNFYKV